MSIRRLAAAHRFLTDRHFYPLVLSSALACALVFGRAHLSGHLWYRFMIWNLFLAWLPYLVSLWTETIYARWPGDWWRLIAPGAVWLLFFPNAPYIITDFVHLRQWHSSLWWYDIGLIASFAWTGCFLAAASLSVMQRLVQAAAGRAASWLFVFGVALLGGLGVYMGRFLRWNSWDALLTPRLVAVDVLESLANPRDLKLALGVTVLVAALLVVCYVTLIGMRAPAPAGERR